jgi:predicted SnoaL-like aldol condensation-catalyzing enzyme
MRASQQIFGAVAGIAAAVAVTLWSASENGPRGRKHYEALAAENMGTRDVILAFEKMGIDGHDPAGAMRKYFAPDMIEHDPRVAGTRDSVIQYLEGRGWSGPAPKRTIHNIIVEGELGVVHHHVKLKPEDPGLMAVDIFRVRNGKVIEHWDVLQPIPANSINRHGAF